MPPSLYPLVVEKLLNCKPRALKEWGTSQQWHNFFVDRCSREFLVEYMAVDHEFIPELLKLWSYLSAIAAPRVLERLFNEQLLTEQHRQEIFAIVSELAIDTPDEGWLIMPEFRTLLTEDERMAILDLVRDILVPNLDEVLLTWDHNSSIDEKTTAEDYYGPLIDTLEKYADALANDRDSLESLTHYIKKIEFKVQEIDAARGEYEARGSRPQASKNELEGTRSIFDDLDM